MRSMPYVLAGMRTLTRSAKRWLVDALLYGLSALFAAFAVAAADIPLQRTWGRTAVWGYLVAAAIATAASFRRERGRREERDRLLLVIAVFAVTAVVPLVSAAYLRAAGNPGHHAQAEVIIVEEGADALLDGRDPYTVDYVAGPLAERPRATQIHFPYLPFMLAFGIPRASMGHAAWADARVWFTLFSLAVAVSWLLRMRTTSDARIRVFQVLFALPTGALLLATGGDDIPVLALLLATCVVAQRGEATATGVVAGLALATKQTSLLILPFIALAISGRSERRRSTVTAGLVGLGLALPFALWDVRAFLEDVVLFPLGLGKGASAANTPTAGSLLLDLFPSARKPITVVLILSVVGVVAVLLRSSRGSSMAGACTRAGGAFLVACALAPVARVGYLIYPVNLLAWALAFRETEQANHPDTSDLRLPSPGT